MNLQECFLKLTQIEEEGAELYKKASLKCSEKLRPAILSFYQEEKEHKNTMMELHKEGRFKLQKLDEDIEKIFNYQVDYMNKEKNFDFNDEKEFFQFALQIEKNSIDIYTKLLGSFEADCYEYKIFETLIKEEKKHMIFILNKLYEIN